MRITYFARPIPAGIVPIAKINPWAFVDDNWFWRTWSEERGRPESLVMDEFWADLRGLLSMGGTDPPRPAFELFRGEPKLNYFGAIPFERVLEPSQVAAAAEDLAQTDLKELYQHCLPLHSPDWAAILNGRRDVVATYLAMTAKFTTMLASRGMGLIYSIG